MEKKFEKYFIIGYVFVGFGIGYWTGRDSGKEAQLKEMKQESLENNIIKSLNYRLEEKDDNMKKIVELMIKEDQVRLDDDISRIKEIRAIVDDIDNLSNQDIKIKLLQLK